MLKYYNKEKQTSPTATAWHSNPKLTPLITRPNTLVVAFRLQLVSDFGVCANSTLVISLIAVVN